MATNSQKSWASSVLGEIAELNWGDTSVTKASYVPSGFPAYSASGQDGYLPYADFERTGVVISAIGVNCGTTWLAKGQWSCIKNTLYFWSKVPEVDTEYLYWYTKNKNFWPKRGSAQPFISQQDARGVTVNYPPLAEQRRIAHILGTLDDKIELNRRMNATLEAIARALFKSWFVDFDPVRAKAAGRPSGLPPALDALFPSRFVDSELGEIPEGWEVKAIGDVVEVVGGGTPSTKNPEYWEGGTYTFATPKDLSSITSPILLETKKKVTEAGLERISSGLLPKGTLLMSSRAPVGYLAISAIPVCINQGFIGMKCDGLSNYFVLNWARVNMSQIQAAASGTTFPEISKANFRPLKILLPSMSLLNAFDRTGALLYSEVERNLRENSSLSKIRDSLIASLIERVSSTIEEPNRLS